MARHVYALWGSLLYEILFSFDGNTFYIPNSSGYFIDSTIYITSIADSVGRPDAPPLGLQGYVITMTVYFKAETSDSLSWNIIQNCGCDTLRVFRCNDPVFDPYENDIYNIKCDNINSIKNKLIFFNWLKEVKIASPDYIVIQP